MNSDIPEVEKMNTLKAVAPLLIMICASFIFAFLLYPNLFDSYKSEVERGASFVDIGRYGMSFIILAPFSLIIGIFGLKTASKYILLFGRKDMYGIILMIISFTYIIFNYRLVIWIGSWIYPYMQLNCLNC